MSAEKEKESIEVWITKGGRFYKNGERMVFIPDMQIIEAYLNGFIKDPLNNGYL